MKVQETTPKAARTFTLDVSEVELRYIRDLMGKDTPHDLIDGTDTYTMFCDVDDLLSYGQ